MKDTYKPNKLHKPWAICAVLHGGKPQVFGPYLTRNEAECHARFYRSLIPQGTFNVFYLPGKGDQDHDQT